MFSGKHIVSNKKLLIAIALVQFVFSVNAYFVSMDSTSTKCSAMKKEVKRHCSCCKSCKAENESEICSTVTVTPDVNGQKVTQCQCVFKTSSNSEYTPQNYFELQKVFAAGIIYHDSKINYSQQVYSKVSNTINENSPPLYLTESTLLI
jgi:hypothetical protein